PPGPVPWIWRRSTPRSVASLRASGDASTLPPAAGAAVAGRAAVAVDGAGRAVCPLGGDDAEVAEVAVAGAAGLAAGAAWALGAGVGVGAAGAAGFAPPEERALASSTS